MKPTRWTVALYMALVFACGGVAGAFAYRLYTVSEVSANVGPRNPEEFRKRFMADLKSRLQLSDDQAAKLGAIMDETRMQVRAARMTIEPELQKIREDQRQRISELLIAQPTGGVAKDPGRTAAQTREQEKPPSAARRRSSAALSDGLFLFGFGGVANLLILLLETVDAAFGVDQLLFAGEKRVATGANFNADVAFVGRAGAELVSASAGHVHFFVGRVDTRFHGEALKLSLGIFILAQSPDKEFVI